MINIVSYGEYWLIYILVRNNHPIRAPKHRQYFDELNNGGFDLTNGFKSSDVHQFEKLNNFFY